MEARVASLTKGLLGCGVVALRGPERPDPEVPARAQRGSPQLKHPAYMKPELLAEGPNEVWSRDITKLKGPVKSTYLYLYVILDISIRYVVGWMVAPGESTS